jgi:hypothetical protein
MLSGKQRLIARAAAWHLLVALVCAKGSAEKMEDAWPKVMSSRTTHRELFLHTTLDSH